MRLTLTLLLLIDMCLGSDPDVAYSMTGLRLETCYLVKGNRVCLLRYRNQLAMIPVVKFNRVLTANGLRVFS